MAQKIIKLITFGLLSILYYSILNFFWSVWVGFVILELQLVKLWYNCQWQTLKWNSKVWLVPISYLLTTASGNNRILWIPYFVDKSYFCLYSLYKRRFHQYLKWSLFIQDSYGSIRTSKKGNSAEVLICIWQKPLANF